MDSFIASSSLLSPTSSTDAISSASLMMIAQQFFQQHQISHDWNSHEILEHQPEEQQQCHNQVEGEEDDVAAYLDGFSPSPTPPPELHTIDSPPGEEDTTNANGNHANNNDISSGSNNEWIDSLMINSCISDPSAESSSHTSSDLFGYHPSAEDVWREHFGGGFTSGASCCSSDDPQHQQHPQQQQQQQQQDWSMDLIHNNLTDSTTGTGFDHLIQLIVSCLDNIDAGHSQAASRNLAALKSLGCSSGDSVQRTAFYFTAGLESRMRGESEREEAELDDEAVAVAYKTLNDACPYVKFAHLTANQALLEATEGAAKIHIVDYGTMHGVQWAAFLQAMATWGSSEQPRSLRITGIPSPHLGPNPAPAMLATKRRLAEFAKLLGVEFEFCPVLHPLEEFRPEEHLRAEPDEVVVLNLVLQLAQLPTSALKTAFSLVERLNPRVVAVAEYEMNTGGMSIREQIASNVRFYCAVFESMDVAVKRDDPQRMDAERRFLGREIRRSLGRKDGSSTWQHQEQQKSIIHRAGLWSAPMSHYSISQARLLLWLYNKSDNFTLVQAPGSLSLGWLGTNVVTVSTWHC